MISEDLLRIIKIIKEYSKIYSTKVYIVGGFIRDYLLGMECKDLDLLITPFNVDFLYNLSNVLKGKIFVLDEERKYFRIVIKKNKKFFILDFTPIYQENILIELTRRDFTINTMLLDLQNFTLIDPLNGLRDLEQNILRLCSPTSLIDDPLRILRAFRFSASGFRIDDKIYENILKIKEKLKEVKPERIHEELYKILTKPFTSNIWQEMEKVGVLDILIPELTSLKNIPWSEPHYENPFLHSITTLYVLEKIYFNLDIFFPNLKKDLEKYLDERIYSDFSKREALKLAALLHDIGKAKTYIIENNEVHYYGHSTIGTELLTEIAQRLKFSNKELLYIQKLIKNHMYLIDFIKNPKTKPLYKLISRVNDDVPSLILLFLSDQTAIKRSFENIEYFNNLLSEFFKLRAIPKPLLNGKEIMEIFNLKPSPIIGFLKEKLIEAQMEGSIKNKEEAIKYLEKVIKNETTT